MTGTVEFEMAKVRNLILSQYFPEYSDALNDTLKYARTDPSSGLLKSRQILEDIGRNIWSKYQDSPAPSVFEVFNEESIKVDTPKRLLNRVHSLRSICNIGIHGDPVTKDDVILSLNHLSVILEWYGTAYKNLGEFPTAIQPPHSFMRYIKDSISDKLFYMVVILNTVIPALVFRYHNKLPDELHRPFRYVYEGIFAHIWFSFIYSVALVLISLVLAWVIFKRFRKQDQESRLLSFQLMYATVFGLQFILLHILDYFTPWF